MKSAAKKKTSKPIKKMTVGTMRVTDVGENAPKSVTKGALCSKWLH